jgi:hypothetical protein
MGTLEYDAAQIFVNQVKVSNNEQLELALVLVKVRVNLPSQQLPL